METPEPRPNLTALGGDQDTFSWPRPQCQQLLSAIPGTEEARLKPPRVTLEQI
jgi:hypothetical protein